MFLIKVQMPDYKGVDQCQLKNISHIKLDVSMLFLKFDSLKLNA